MDIISARVSVWTSTRSRRGHELDESHVTGASRAIPTKSRDLGVVHTAHHHAVHLHGMAPAEEGWGGGGGVRGMGGGGAGAMGQP